MVSPVNARLVASRVSNASSAVALLLGVVASATGLSKVTNVVGDTPGTVPVDTSESVSAVAVWEPRMVVIVAAGSDELDAVDCMAGDACEEICSRDALDDSCIASDEGSEGVVGSKVIPVAEVAVRNLSAT
jgi:hypothetical protein